MPREKMNIDQREVSPGDQRLCGKRACSRYLCVNRRESFSASTGVVELGKGEERQQKTTLASLSWLYLVTWRFLLSQWPLRIKNDVEIPPKRGSEPRSGLPGIQVVHIYV